MPKKNKRVFITVYPEDGKRIKDEIKRENNSGVGYRASTATVIRAALRAYIECPQCNLTLNKCNCGK
jgi:hypothetical protein